MRRRSLAWVLDATRGWTRAKQDPSKAINDCFNVETFSGRNPSRPVTVFVDVDGAVAPMSHFDGAQSVVLGGWHGTVLYDPMLAELMVNLQTSGRVRFRWLTTWGHAAAEVLAPALGLPVFPVHPEPSEWVLDGWWKRKAVEGWEGPCGWIDDEIAPSDVEAVPTRVVTHAPSPGRGLRPVDLLDVINAIEVDILDCLR